jgi:hypothetical protein
MSSRDKRFVAQRITRACISTSLSHISFSCLKIWNHLHQFKPQVITAVTNGGSDCGEKRGLSFIFIGSQRELDKRSFWDKKLKSSISLSISRARIDKYGEPKAGPTFFLITGGRRGEAT